MFFHKLQQNSPLTKIEVFLSKGQKMNCLMSAIMTSAECNNDVNERRVWSLPLQQNEPDNDNNDEIQFGQISFGLISLYLIPLRLFPFHQFSSRIISFCLKPFCIIPLQRFQFYLIPICLNPLHLVSF